MALIEKHQRTLRAIFLMWDDYNLTTEWVERLQPYGRPVLWCDIWDIINTKSLPPIRNPNLFLFHRDEVKAGKKLLSHLYARGHRRVTCPIHELFEKNVFHKYWTKNRLEIIRWLIQTDFPEMTFVDRKLAAPFWIHDMKPRMFTHGWHDIVVSDKLKSFTTFPLEDFYFPESVDQATVFEQTRELGSMITDEGCTAIIGLNDHLAAKFLHWSIFLEEKLPFRPSVIGIDNSSYARAFSLTSVDFMFKDLGYRAAEVICSSERPPYPQDRDIMAEPLLIDRGSVYRV